MNMRWCTREQTYRPQSDFGYNAATKDGRAYICKSCNCKAVKSSASRRKVNRIIRQNLTKH